MRFRIVFIFIVLILIGIGVFWYIGRNDTDILQNQIPRQRAPIQSTIVNEIPRISIVAENLDTPWAIAFLPDGSMLITERPGRVRLLDNTGRLDPEPVGLLPTVREIGEGGLMGIALHPDYSLNNYVYLYYTYSGSGVDTLNRVVRMVYRNNTLSAEEIVIDRIPGASNHNGGRIKFGPDKYLYITTGDAQEPSLAQNRNSLAGKILRVTDNGEPAPGNPFSNRVFSYGHRNPQGLDWDSGNSLWSTEHGPSGGLYGTGRDEVNRIESGRNYGWPEIQGDQAVPAMEHPVVHSGQDTWAPAGAALIGNSLFFGGLRGEALYELDLGNPASVTGQLKSDFGRIREVIKGPDALLYLTTSNRDGRGNPKNGDDKIIKINPSKL